MNSTKLLQFKTIAECGSIREASQKLYISQPALSKCVSSLEEELNCRLFNRTGRKIFLNDNGKKLLNYANELDNLMKHIVDDFTLHNNRKTLKISSTGSFFSMFWIDFFKDGMKPVQFEIVNDAQIPTLLFHGDSDAVISDDSYLRASNNSRLLSIPLLKEQLFLVVPWGHELAGKQTLTITNLNNASVMRISNNHGVNQWVEQILERNHVRLNWTISLDMFTYRDFFSTGIEPLPHFSSSSLYFSSKRDSQDRNKQSYVPVSGNYTQRMLYLWYLKENERYLYDLLNCIKKVYSCQTS